MLGTIELRAFMDLAEVFKERQWSSPHAFPLDGETSGFDLLAKLDIPLSKVEVIFINRKAVATAGALIHPGDRVALVPPGMPGPHRLLLGFKNK